MNTSILADESLRAARMPVASLHALAVFRTRNDIRVSVIDDEAWVWWDSSDSELVQSLLAAPDATFFAQRNGEWFEAHSLLPMWDMPASAPTQRLDEILTPSPFAVIRPEPLSEPPKSIELVRDVHPRTASALRCTWSDFVRWADTATTFSIERLEAAKSDDVVWLRGEHLPPIAKSERFWGERLLLPLGFRAEPDWPESMLLAIADVPSSDVVVVLPNAIEIIPANAWGPVSRAAIRRVNP